MNADRLSGRYCAPQTVNQSERAANDRAKLPENTAAWTNPTPKAGLFTNLQPCIGLRPVDIAAAL
ncbi:MULTISPECIES: hypothetical protein [Bradyrhizobium]|uniref:Uncharacterized protein n=1 Tax=Bradyrhizobium frederickii TaxID=2560054 RepID=A0A4Y9L3V4_9BRAD|nr:MULTISPECIES: hypothetical protein [Bradyrhizobium]TFV36713.1 hypothetical protein E4K66_22130 [Bradyrhizobium frederickii]